MIYQRISLATTDPVGDPGPLPFAVANWKPEQVLDLSHLDAAYGFTDAGFWPVVDDIPDYDPATETVVAGDLTKDGPGKRFVREWTVEALPVPVPSEISSSQFFRALWKSNRITFDECRAALKTGDLPAAMEAMVDQLPENEQQDALLIIEGATTFRRAHPLVPVFAQLYGMTDEETDDLWRAAAALP